MTVSSRRAPGTGSISHITTRNLWRASIHIPGKTGRWTQDFHTREDAEAALDAQLAEIATMPPPKPHKTRKTARRAQGEGGLFWVPSIGMWRGVVDAGRDLEGGRIQVQVHARTQDACRDKLDDLKARIAETGGGKPAAMVTLADWAEEWLEHTVRVSKDPKTYSTYRSLVRRSIVPLLGTRTLRQIIPSDAARLRTHIVDVRGQSSSTARQAQIVLSLMLDAAVDDRRIPTNPVKGTRRTKAAASQRRAFTTDEAITLLRCAAARPDGTRWWMKLLYGQRQGELLGGTLDQLTLTYDDEGTATGGSLAIEWKLEELRREHGCGGTCGKAYGAACPQARWAVPDGFEMRHLEGRWCLTRPKSAAGTRVQPLIPQIATMLQCHIAATADQPNPHGLIFHHPDGSPITPRQDEADWRQLLTDAGIITPEQNRPGGTVLTGHCARHTTITILAELGVDMQLIGLIVGQSSEQVTRIYRHAREAEKLAALRGLADKLAGPLQLGA